MSQGLTPSVESMLDPRTLSEIESLAFHARTIAESIISGAHRSRLHGNSAEFSEHKEYSPGDDLRALDWRAYARLDRDYVKRYENESSLRALCVVDVSGSMDYPAEQQRATKLQQASVAAAALAYVLEAQGDAVGLAAAGERLEIRVPARARRGQLQEVLTELVRMKAEGPSRLGATLDTLAEGLRQRTIVALFTDLLDGGLEGLESLRRLRARRHDVVVFHVLDPDELDFPFEDTTRFVSLEDDQELQIDARAVRRAYQEEMTRFREAARSACASARVDYRLFRTDESPGKILAEVLNARTQRRRR